MAKNIRGKRPCSICRKWFQPIAQQKGRQKTCSPECQREHHRRQCENWNRKNKAYFKNNYLADKVNELKQQEQSKDSPADRQKQAKDPPAIFLPQPSHQRKPVLPLEVIVAQLGEKQAIIMRYLVTQVTRYVLSERAGFT
jgi:hypothetical protein